MREDVRRKALLSVLFEDAYDRVAEGSIVDLRGELKESFQRLLHTADRLHSWTTDLLKAFPSTPSPASGEHLHRIEYVDRMDLDDETEDERKPEPPPLPDERPEVERPPRDPEPAPTEPPVAARVERRNHGRSKSSRSPRPLTGVGICSGPTPADLYGWSNFGGADLDD